MTIRVMVECTSCQEGFVLDTLRHTNRVLRGDVVRFHARSYCQCSCRRLELKRGPAGRKTEGV